MYGDEAKGRPAVVQATFAALASSPPVHLQKKLHRAPLVV